MSWLNSAAVCERYNIGPRTIYRWVAAGVLPVPVYMRGRKYWPIEQLNACDKARMAVAQPSAREMPDRVQP